MPPEAAASDRGSSTRSGGAPRGPRVCGPERLCPAGTMAGRRPALSAEAERTRVVVRWLSTTTRVPVGCGHIGFAQAPHPKADRACQPHGRSHLGVGLARRASQFPGRCRCSGACRTLLERRLPLPTRRKPHCRASRTLRKPHRGCGRAESRLASSRPIRQGPILPRGFCPSGSSLLARQDFAAPSPDARSPNDLARVSRYQAPRIAAQHLRIDRRSADSPRHPTHPIHPWLCSMTRVGVRRCWRSGPDCPA